MPNSFRLWPSHPAEGGSASMLPKQWVILAYSMKFSRHSSPRSLLVQSSTVMDLLNLRIIAALWQHSSGIGQNELALSFVHRCIPGLCLRVSGGNDSPQSLHILILLLGAYGVIFEKDLALVVYNIASVSPGLDVCPDPTSSTSFCGQLCIKRRVYACVFYTGFVCLSGSSWRPARASASASSLPLILECPGIHLTSSLQKRACERRGLSVAKMMTSQFEVKV